MVARLTYTLLTEEVTTTSPPLLRFSLLAVRLLFTVMSRYLRPSKEREVVGLTLCDTVTVLPASLLVDADDGVPQPPPPPPPSSVPCALLLFIVVLVVESPAASSSSAHPLLVLLLHSHTRTQARTERYTHKRNAQLSATAFYLLAKITSSQTPRGTARQLKTMKIPVQFSLSFLPSLPLYFSIGWCSSVTDKESTRQHRRPGNGGVGDTKAKDREC